MKNSSELALLQAICAYAESKVQKDALRYSEPRTRLLAGICSAATKTLEDLQLDFENVEVSLRDGLTFGNWHVRYNAISDDVVCERILEPDHLLRLIELRNKILIESVSGLLFKISGQDFQVFVAELFQRVQWVEQVTDVQLAKDGGIDFAGVFVHKDSGIRMPLFGQVKRWKNAATVAEIRDFIGSISLRTAGNATGVFVSISGFTKDAEAVIAKSPYNILLYDLEDVVDLMSDSGIGIKVQQLMLIAPDEVYWRDRIDK